MLHQLAKNYGGWPSDLLAMDPVMFQVNVAALQKGMAWETEQARMQEALGNAEVLNY